MNSKKLKNTLQWKHYLYGINSDYNCWEVHNLITKKHVLASSESAILKIIELAVALRNGQPKPLNHKTLEKKAKHLEGFGKPTINSYRTWNNVKYPYKGFIDDI